MKIPDRINYSALNFPICNFVVLEEAERLIIPDYQRDYIWSDTQKGLLIDSIFKSIPIGNIFLNERGGSPAYEIIDGQQRLTTLFKFMNDEFAYQDVYYSELPDKYTARISHFVVQTYITYYTDVKDILRLYYVLNWAGTQHNVEEMIKLKRQAGEEDG